MLRVLIEIVLKAGIQSESLTRLSAIKKVNTIDERRSKIVRKRDFDCHLSPNWRQMAIEYTVSSDFLSMLRAYLIAAYLM